MRTNSCSSEPRLALTRQQTAEALSLSCATVDRLTQRGLLHPSRATRRPLYTVEEVERFLRETASHPHPGKRSA